MKARTRFGRIVALAAVTTLVLGVAVLGLAGCRAKETGTIKLGMPVPMNTPYAESMRQGADLAVKEINESGGLLGRQVEAFYEDDQMDPNMAMDKVTSLIEKDKVDAIIGIISSACRDAVIPIVYRNQKVFIYPTTYEGGVAAKFKDTGAKYVFTTGPVPEQYLKPYVDWLVEAKGTSFYFIGMDHIWGRGSIAAARVFAEEAGCAVVGEEYVPEFGSDFSTALNRVAAAKPDVLYIVHSGDPLITLVKQFHEFGLDQKGITLAVLLDETYMQAFTPEEVTGVCTSYPYFMNVQTAENEAFIAGMRASYGEDVVVSMTAESMYAAVMFYATAVKAADSVDTDKVVAALEGATIAAPEGSMTIRAADHQASGNCAIAVIEPDPAKPYADWFNIVVSLHGIEAPPQGD